MQGRSARCIATLWWAMVVVGTSQLLAGGVVRAIDPRGELFGFDPLWVRLLTETWAGVALLLVAAVVGVIAVVRTRERADDPGLLRWSRAIRVVIFLLSTAGLGFALAFGWDEMLGHVFREAAPWAAGAIGVLIGCVVVICLLSWIVQRLAEKVRRYPVNIDDVPEPFRSYAKDRGAVWPGVRDALHGGILGAVLSIVWALRPGASEALSGVVVGSIAILVFGFLALAAWNTDTTEQHAGDALRRRIGRVRAQGLQTRAEVVSVDEYEWTLPYAEADAVQFAITVRYVVGEDEQTGSGEVLVDIEDAPVPGGSVLVWHLGDAGEERYLEPDPQSIRDPQPRSTYRKPEP